VIDATKSWSSTSLAEKASCTSSVRPIRPTESGDALKFTQRLAHVCEAAGRVFRYSHQVTGLDADRSARHVRSIEVCGPGGYRTFRARDIVVSWGAGPAPFMRPYGARLTSIRPRVYR